jgi:hypothetical protein
MGPLWACCSLSLLRRAVGCVAIRALHGCSCFCVGLRSNPISLPNDLSDLTKGSDDKRLTSSSRQGATVTGRLEIVTGNELKFKCRGWRRIDGTCADRVLERRELKKLRRPGGEDVSAERRGVRFVSSPQKSFP